MINTQLIAATGSLEPIAIKLLEPYGRIVIASDTSEDSIISAVREAVGLVVKADAEITSNIINQAKKLKVIARTGAGYNNIDVEAATKRGIYVVFSKGANTRAVAEAALTAMFVLCKNPYFWDQQLKKGNWDSRTKYKPADLEGKTLGIIGFGMIGKTLAEMVYPLNMNILVFDPFIDETVARSHNTQLVSFEGLLKEADIISIHAPLTEDTRGIINSNSLKLCKSGSYLINFGRGGIIDNLNTLLEGLEEGKLAGVWLDVFEPEPPDINHPIFKHPGCITSPHALANTPNAMFNLYKDAAEGIIAVLKNKQPRFLANPEVEV